MNSQATDILVIAALALLMAVFLSGYEFSASSVAASLPEVVWDHRVIESFTQSILIFAAFIGVLALAKG